ncbi:MAG TPA: CoA pyrophosphatase [Candidatus Babeliales bacterium]|nr:CoA pyrophosphatase [Candidatus Babeliales bacterium]
MNESQWRRGAVLVPILARIPHSVIFVERAQHLRRHPGQIGFPGGIEDPADAGDPVKTALRELSEELGVETERVKVVGRLPQIEQGVYRFLITPVVGILDDRTRFAVDGEEIVGVFTVPLAAIVASGALHEDPELSNARGTTSYAFDYEDRRIWGFTARVLKSFVDAWNAPNETLDLPRSLRD